MKDAMPGDLIHEQKKPTIIFDLHEVIVQKQLMRMSFHIIKHAHRLDIIWHMLDMQCMKRLAHLFKTSRVPEQFACELVDHNNKLQKLVPIVIDFANQQRLNTEVITIVQQLKKQQYHTYLFSNIGEKTFGQFVSKYPIIGELFEKYTVCSNNDYWVQKPSKQAFLKCIKNFAIVPEDTIFIDNNSKNIKVARSLGFQTILFKNATQLHKDLIKLNIL